MPFKRILLFAALAFMLLPASARPQETVVPADISLSEISEELPVPFLSELLKSDSPVFRKVAAEFLGNKGDTSAVPALLGILGDKDVEVKMQVVQSLGRLGDTSAVPALIRLLVEKDARVKQKAIDALGELKDETAVIPLINVIKKGKDVALKVDAAYALGNIGRAAIPFLLKSLQGNYKMFAALALGKILEKATDTSAIPALIKALNDRDVNARKDIALVLRKLGKPAVSALLDILRNRGKFAGERSYAAEALGIIGDTSAIPVLLDALDEDNDALKDLAAGALRRMGRSAVASAGKKMVEGAGNFEKRLTNALFLAKYGDERSMQFLVKLLNFEMYRQQATEALEKYFGGKVQLADGSKKITCPACLGGRKCQGCGGSGKAAGPSLFVFPCEWCGGNGTCPVCGGEGSISRAYYKFSYTPVPRGSVDVGMPVVDTGE